MSSAEREHLLGNRTPAQCLSFPQRSPVSARAAASDQPLSNKTVAYARLSPWQGKGAGDRGPETMDEAVREALSKGGTIDITTTGRKTGEPRRIEIAFFTSNGTVYISGIPGRPRSWYANMLADPAFTFHLKQGVTADLPARATPITDEATRRTVLA